VTTPEGSGPIVFEDPRHAMMMAAPPRRKSAPREMHTYVSETPEPGALLIWESWLRHEVPLNRAEGERISVSFNCVVG
ncbi:MAG: TIGR02466 family protein, partial [Parvibaculaceae bacterium]